MVRTPLRSVSTALLVAISATCLPEWSARATTIIASSQTAQAALGDGYDTGEQRFKGSCLDSDPRNFEWYGAQNGEVAFSHAMSSAEAKESLGFGAKARAQYGMISASAAAAFASSTSSDDYSESATYRADFNFKNAVLKNIVFKPVAAERKRSAAAFTEMCGNEYVDQMQLGASLYVNVKVQFARKEDKESFSSQVKVSGPIGSVSASLEKASRNFSKTGFISIRLLQIGGDVEQLATIFAMSGDGSPDGQAPTSSNPLAIVNCSMDDLRSCTAVLRAAIYYASSSFPKQIKPTSIGIGQPGGPAIMRYVTKPWTDVGVRLPNPVANQAIVFAKQRFGELFEEQLGIAHRIKALSLARIRLSPSQRERLRTNEALVNRNIELLKDAANQCYDDDSTCVAGLNGLKQAPIGLQELEILPETFSQYCDLTDDPKHAARLGKTVDALMRIAAKEIGDGSFEGAADRCGLAEELLEGLWSIELPFAGVSDMRPVGTLKGLRRLRLNANPIEDLSPLTGLKELETLNLNSTQVSDVTGLRSLPKLREVLLFQTRTLGQERLIQASLPQAKVRFTENEVCAAERFGLLMDRSITREDYDRYEKANLAPSYANMKDHSVGINAWLACDIAAAAL